MELRRLILDPTVRIAVAVWIAANSVALLLAGGRLPFDRPALEGIPFAVQMAAPTIGMVQILLLLALIYWLTRNRVVADVAGRAPARAVAARETFALVAYAAAGQAGGWIVAPALGYRPFSFHIAGTVYGCSMTPAPGEFATWAIYNFVVFAVVPYLWFRRRYDATQLCLLRRPAQRPAGHRRGLSVRRRLRTRDAGDGLLSPEPAPAHARSPSRFHPIFYWHRAADDGADLFDPASALSQADRLDHGDRFSRGLTYAVMHLIEGWSAFDSPRDTAPSLIFVFLGYTGPGMVKSLTTLRTGNAWVHTIAYRVVAPHVIVDTPLVVQAFGF